MYIDEDFLKKVLLTDAEKLSTREKLKLEFNKNLALKIKSKQLEHNDSLLALKENNINILLYKIHLNIDPLPKKFV